MRNRIRDWAVLAALIVVSGYFHFHALDWNDHGYPHPDERAVISQVYDMMMENHYRPTNFTWGHFGYYSALFAYKAYLYFQAWGNGLERVENQILVSQAGRIPHFRDLVYDGAIVPLGIAAVLLTCAAFMLVRALCRVRLIGLGLLLISLAAYYLFYESIAEAMLVQTRPHYEDVAFVGRFIAAFTSMLCVPVLYDLGRRVYSAKVGLLAAAFYGFTVLGVQLGHFFAVDMLQAFCALLVIWAAAGIVFASPNPTARRMTWGGGDAEPERRGGIMQGVGLGPVVEYLLRVDHSIKWTTLLLYLAMGAALGMAMASKFSSAPMFIIPLVAHVLFIHRARAARQLAPHVFLVLSYISALGSWYYLQPYAWDDPYMPYAAANDPRRPIGERVLYTLFSQEYARQIHEQSQMVKGKGGGPWVQQFAQTKPYLTMTMQMIRWSFGWPLGIVCVGAFFLALVRNVIQPRAGDLLLLSWAGVEFAIIGTFQATFPRYTMGIIPLICLFGAELCLGDSWRYHGKHAGLAAVSRLWGLLRRPAAVVGVAGGFLYCVAFMQVYDRMHSWSYASLWMFKNAPDRRLDNTPTRLVSEEWDDTIPLAVPPHTANYARVRMAPYHGDGLGKAQQIAEILVQLDWIALPTTRLYGTTMVVPHKYPYTIRYYKQLFAGNLGFTLRKTVTRPATLFGWEFDDILADESHHVYDHPKCVIFEKTEQLSAAELYERIVNPPPEVDALTRAQIMRWQEAPAEQLLNILRDPYPDDGAFTLEELQRLLGGPVRLSEAEVAAVEQRLAALPRTPCLAKADLRPQLEEAARAPTRETLATLRSTVQQLPIREAIGVRRVLAVVGNKRLIQDAEHRRRLREHVVAYLNHTVIPRDVVLRKLAAVNLNAGVVPPLAAERPDLQRRAPERKPLITQTGSGWVYEGWQIVKWLLVVQLLSLVALPLCGRFFVDWLDRGYPLAKTLGLVVATYIVWLLVNLGAGYFTVGMIVSALVLTGALSWGWCRDCLAWRWWRENAGAIVATEGLLLFAFGFFLIIRAYNPEIHYGEKTMDFSLYNAMMRTTTFPPYEPWFAGGVLNYYYYGYILLAVVTLLTNTPTALGYNLAMAWIPALTVLCAFSLAYNLTRRLRWGLCGAFFVGFIGNLDPIYQLITRQLLPPLGQGWLNALLHAPTERSPWDSFWAYSRALGQGMINEWPLWSWLFADLHAHVIVMPLSLLLLALVYAWFRSETKEGVFFGQSAVVPMVVLTAIVLGSQCACNIWDFIAYSGFLALALAVRAWLQQPDVAPRLGSRFPAFAAPAEQGTHPFLELARPPLWLLISSLALLIASWVVVWPWLCEWHPYWLGMINGRGFGLGLILIVVALGLARWIALDVSDWLAWRGWRLIGQAAVPLVLLIGLGFVFFYHFHANLKTDSATIKFNNDGNIMANHAFRHFGFFMILTVLWVVMGYAAAFGRRGKQDGANAPSPWGPLVFLLAGELAVWMLCRQLGLIALVESRLPDGTSMARYHYLGGAVYMLLLPPVASMLWLVRNRADQLFTATLLLGGWGIAALSELIVIIDRMNTVFKLYHPAWMLLALGTAAGLASVRLEWMGGIIGRWRTNSIYDVVARPFRFVLCAALALLLACVALTTYRCVHGVVVLNRKKSDKPTINGVDFLRHTPAERQLLEAVDWLNRHVAGPRVVSEAFTNQGYDYAPGGGPTSTRVVMFTGLPTLLGWPHHTRQRGRSSEEIYERDRDLRTLYMSDDDELARAVVEKYNIEYVYVGYFENMQYNYPLKTVSQRSFLREVFRNDENVIFEVSAR